MSRYRGGNDELDMELFHQVLDAALLTRRVFSKEALKGEQPSRERPDKQLKPSGAQALFVLVVKPGLTVSELAKELNVSQSAMSFAVARLLEAGYVEDSTDANDKRVKHHVATDAGHMCVQRILDRVSNS